MGLARSGVALFPRDTSLEFIVVPLVTVPLCADQLISLSFTSSPAGGLL